MWRCLKDSESRVPKTKAIKSHWQIIILMIFITCDCIGPRFSCDKRDNLWSTMNLRLGNVGSFNWWVPSISILDFYSIHVLFSGLIWMTKAETATWFAALGIFAVEASHHGNSNRRPAVSWRGDLRNTGWPRVVWIDNAMGMGQNTYIWRVIPIKWIQLDTM